MTFPDESWGLGKELDEFSRLHLELGLAPAFDDCLRLHLSHFPVFHPNPAFSVRDRVRAKGEKKRKKEDHVKEGNANIETQPTN